MLENAWHRLHSWELWFYRTVADAWWQWSALLAKRGTNPELSHRAIFSTVWHNIRLSAALNRVAHRQGWLYHDTGEVLKLIDERLRVADSYQRHLDRLAHQAKP